MSNFSHKYRVVFLYKFILRLHRFLPIELRSLGDSYVRQEFKKHKIAEPIFVPKFMIEWNNYAATLAEQVRQPRHEIGNELGSDKLDNFRHEQLMQLLELFNSVRLCDDQIESDKNA